MWMSRKMPINGDELIDDVNNGDGVDIVKLF